MAYIDIVSPNNLEVYSSFLPPVLMKKFIEEEGYAFYGINEGDEAVGTVVIQESGDRAKLRYIYILPHLRGTGVMDRMLSELFLRLRDEYVNYVSMNYIPKVHEFLGNLSRRFGFRERRLDYGYFRFTCDDIFKSKVASIAPQGVISLKYLPEDKRQRLWKLVTKYMNIYEDVSFVREEFMSYSIVYLENDDPKGVLLIHTPDFSGDHTVENQSKYPENGAYDIALFFVGMGQQKAPLYLLSALCRIIKKELPDNTLITGYFPEGHVVKLIEGVFGVEARHEICATLDLGSL